MNKFNKSNIKLSSSCNLQSFFKLQFVSAFCIYFVTFILYLVVAFCIYFLIFQEKGDQQFPGTATTRKKKTARKI